MLKRTAATITALCLALGGSLLTEISPALATAPSCSAFFSTDQGMSSGGGTGTGTCVVPDGIYSIKVKATGAGGGYGWGGSSRSSSGGNGGLVEATLSVTPGETLNIEVGEAGTTTSATTSYRGGSGGGWTALFRGSTPLIIAGGGGGGGSTKDSSTSLTMRGGNGADYGSEYGTDGSPAPYIVSGSAVACSGYGGNAMTLGAACEPAYLSGQTGTAGGAGAYEIGGDGIGYNGALTTGANRYHAGTIASTNFSPGSGGAGYIGGGGGGNSSASGGGGSGGGGSSYIDSGATGTSFSVANNGGYRERSSMQNAGNGLIEIYSAAMSPTISSIAAGDSMATVTYAAPTENGGGVITNYKYSIDGGVWTALQPASTSGTFTIPNLTNGTTYDVRVRAVNAYGDGVPSSPTSVTPALPNLSPVSPGSNPNIPTSGVPLGQSVFLIDGQLSSVTVSPDSQSDPTALQITGTGFTMELKGLGANGQPLGLDSTGALILESDRTAHVEGTGFKPNSDVEVYLFSNPRHVGTVRTDNSGNFNGNLAIPNDVPAGRHTLQSNGVSTSGQVRSLSLGVRLNENSELASTGFNMMTPLSLAVMMFTTGLVLANSPYFRKRKIR